MKYKNIRNWSKHMLYLHRFSNPTNSYW